MYFLWDRDRRKERQGWSSIQWSQTQYKSSSCLSKPRYLIDLQAFGESGASWSTTKPSLSHRRESALSSSILIFLSRMSDAGEKNSTVRSPIQLIRYHPQGLFAFAVGSHLQVFDEAWVFPFPFVLHARNHITQIAFSIVAHLFDLIADLKWFIYSSYSIRETGIVMTTLEGPLKEHAHTDTIRAISFGRDGISSHLYLVSVSDDKTIKVWLLDSQGWKFLSQRYW